MITYTGNSINVNINDNVSVRDCNFNANVISINVNNDNLLEAISCRGNSVQVTMQGSNNIITNSLLYSKVSAKPECCACGEYTTLDDVSIIKGYDCYSLCKKCADNYLCKLLVVMGL